MQFALSWLVGGCLCLAAGLSACAGESRSSAHTVRVVAKLAQPSEDSGAIARRAEQSARVPVAYAAGVSPDTHALVLSCPDDGACGQAISRLRADTSFFRSVERDGMKKKP